MQHLAAIFTTTAIGLLLCSTSLAGCANPEGSDVAAARKDDVVGGQLETGSPAVGYLLAARWPSPPLWLVCGATLIAPDIAVTAAHCVRDYDTFAVGFGAAGTAMPIPVRHPIRHPEYPGTGFRHDLAVLVLESDSLIPPLEIVPPTVGALARYIGYGRTIEGPKNAQGGWTFERKRATQEVLAADTLNVWTRGVDGGTCYGDSGGPLLMVGDRPGIAGVLWGSPPEEDVLCEPGSTRIFTSLSGERAFIDRAIACKDSYDPDCLLRAD